jgi:hypothetical protein
VAVEIDAFCLAAAAVPLKDQPPLPVHSDRVELRQVAAQLLEMIAGRNSQVLIGRRVVDHLKLAEEAALEIGRDIPGPGIVNEEGAQPLVSKAQDHADDPFMGLCTTLRYKRQSPKPDRRAGAEGSLKWTVSAERVNAENLLALRSPALAAFYAENFARRRAASTAYARE